MVKMDSNQKQSEPIKIGLRIDNLMDRVRVGDNLKQKGFDCQNISGTKACFEFLLSNPQSLVILDLQNSSLKFDMIQTQFVEHDDLLKRIVCYFPHIQMQLKKDAQGCGIEHIYPRSVFFADGSALMQQIIAERKL